MPGVGRPDVLIRSHMNYLAFRGAAARRWASFAGAWLLCAAALAGCTVATPPTEVPLRAPTGWQAAAPAAPDARTEALLQWWSRLDDPVLAALVEQAQDASPTLAQAQARLLQARANLAAAGGARQPSLTGTVNANRSASFTTGMVAANVLSAGADAGWELDLFGALRHGVSAAQARAEGAGLAWHDARLSVAADVANTYTGLRACEQLAAVYGDDATSQERTATLTAEKVRVGFESPANGSLAEAARAQSRERAIAQQAQCDLAVKALVELTGQDEPALRAQLAPGRARLPQPAAFAVAALPAQVLAQRPDVAAASRDLAAAAYDAGVAEAQRYPSVKLAGSVTAGLVRIGGTNNDVVTWSIGPSVSLPLFDGGRRRAQAEAARAVYDERRGVFDQRLRRAVREVEEALVTLDAAQRRETDAATAARHYRRYFESTEERWRLGAGSVIDMEEARRAALTAQATHVGVQRERVSAWIGLYRAVGGGWRAEDPTP
jgi:NodT family efflux transporter outer membrane factor (OMF) lipoprotein